jgi:hypothetical protein
MREFGYSEAQAYNVMRDVALEVLLAQPDYFVRSSLGHVVTLFRGQEEPLRVHLARLANSRLREDWEAHPELAPLLPAPVTPEERGRTLRSAIDVVRVYEPSEPRVAPVLAVLFVVGGLAILLRPAWQAAAPLPLVVLAVVVLSAFLDGPVPRFRYPVDPFISLTAAAGLLAVLQLVRSMTSQVPGLRSQAPGPRSQVGESSVQAQRAELT